MSPSDNRKGNDVSRTQAQAALMGGLPGALSDLALLDPEFTLEGFIEESKNIFSSVKAALWTPDPVALTRYLNQPALEKMVYQARRLLSAGNLMKVEGFEIVQAEVTSYPDNVEGIELGVSFHWKTQSEKVCNSLTGQVVSDLGGSHHREVWVFVRDPKATESGTPQMQERCPHCSAPLKLQNGNCAFCKNPVRVESGLWQVVKISITG